MADKRNQINSLWAEIKETFNLNVDYAKFTVAEKLTVFLTVVALAAICFVVVSFMIFFLSIALVNCLATSIGQIWAYFIMFGFYIVLLVVVFVFRKQLIVNPIARFISRLIFKP